MRAIVLLTLILFAGICHAEDPLESLNSIQDTVAAMEQTLDAQAWDPEAGNDRVDAFIEDVYFVSYEPLAPTGWVKAWPCTLESAVSFIAPDFIDCKPPEGEDESGRSRLWRSRQPISLDLQPGVLVLAQDLDNGGAWFLTKITGVYDITNGYVEVAAPFRAQVKGLRVVEE